ncbi:hypothetical protein V1525DRAFT_396355 [Lipomyces kononenkoae]|uniref:Uncharacterized protein n=1 Tax=Lipomyces kononenkoae TaxID=34357 RepID=A0ACC3T8E7_LIPKO
MLSRLKYKFLNQSSEFRSDLSDSVPDLPRTRQDNASIHTIERPPIHRIETSFNIFLTFARIRAHKLRGSDLQYVFLFFVGVFCFFVVEEPKLVFKILIAIALLTAILIPVTSQFFFPFLPIAAYLFLFYSSRFIPTEWRPSIWVTVLPTLETSLYGGNLSSMLASNPKPVLDILAWLPYGIMHYGAPFVVSILIFVFASPGSLPVFARSFGYMSLFGVIIQNMFPTCPPWYEISNGLTPASYSMPGSPGGLARVDQLLGTSLYTSAFSASPLAFGAFPSLHSADSVLEALFLSHVFPRLTPLFVVYVLWIWWSTMYLTHHYFIDLTGGAVLATSIFLVARWNFLPNPQKGKRSRWQYEYIELADYDRPPPSSSSRRPPLNRKLTTLGASSLEDDDEMDDPFVGSNKLGNENGYY